MNTQKLFKPSKRLEVVLKQLESVSIFEKKEGKKATASIDKHIKN